MQSNTDLLTKCEERIAHNTLERQQLHDVTTLAAEIKRLLVRYGDTLKEEGIRKDMRKLEEWLESQRGGPAPACVISESGISWLTALRDKIKLSAEEAQRLEGEGGPPLSREQSEKTEDLLNVVRRIDKIIGETSVKTH